MPLDSAPLLRASVMPPVLDRPLLTPAQAASVGRIATFHLNGLGDLLFTLPALRGLREAFPQATLWSVVRPALAPLLHGSGLADEVVVRSRGAASKAALIAKLRAGHIDLAIAFSQSGPSVLLARATGAPLRVGYTRSKFEGLLTHRIPGGEKPSAPEKHRELARALGCRTTTLDYHGLIRVAPDYEWRAEALLAEHRIAGPFIVASYEASQKRKSKEWPASHWAEALDRLAGRRWPVVLVGTRPSPDLHETLRRYPQAVPHVVDLSGRTNLPTLAALCGRASLCIGTDSGVLHLAAAMGTPVVGIYGPTDWRRTGPQGASHRLIHLDLPCSPCLRSRCPWTGDEERKCLTQLAPRAVVEAACELISAQQPAR